MKNRSRSNWWSFALSIGMVFVATFGNAAQTSRVSVDSLGAQADDGSYSPSISADGRYVVFYSFATNLVEGDTNARGDVFLHDRRTGQTTRVSVDSDEVEGNDWSSYNPFISADGRYVSFGSNSSNLVPNDTNGKSDVFIRNLLDGTTSRVSIRSAGGQGNGNSANTGAPISADGRFVAFTSFASNLLGGDTNGVSDVFLHDRSTGSTTRMSIDSGRVQGNNLSQYPAINGNGRYVAFGSLASNLVADDLNDTFDVFVRDRGTETTTRVSVADSTGAEGNSWSNKPSISSDGRYVAFESDASNLVAGDTNAWPDVFVRDRKTGTTTLVSVNSAGEQGDEGSRNASISANGRFVVFSSNATNLVAGDINALPDIFLRDLSTGVTTRLSVTSAGIAGNGDSPTSSISADGRYVAFMSGASNLVPGDTNFDLGTKLGKDVFVRDRWLTKYLHGDLEVAVTSEPVSVVLGATASYTFTVTNNGASSVTATLIDTISKAPASLTSSQGFCTASAVSVCKLGTLAPTASATVTVGIKATDSNPITQQVSVDSYPVDDVPGNNSVTVTTPVVP